MNSETHGSGSSVSFSHAEDVVPASGVSCSVASISLQRAHYPDSVITQGTHQETAEWEKSVRERKRAHIITSVFCSKHVDIPAIFLVNIFSLPHYGFILLRTNLGHYTMLYILQQKGAEYLLSLYNIFLFGTILFCRCTFECGFEALMTVKVNILYREVYTILLWLNIDFSFPFEPRWKMLSYYCR